MTNTRLTDPEIIERRYPVRIREFRIRPDSGGRGRRRGGDGVVRTIEFLRPVVVSMLSERRGPFAPFGLDGGEDGSLGRNTLQRAGTDSIQDLGGKFAIEAGPGDVLTIETPGGGGFGTRGASLVVEVVVRPLVTDRRDCHFLATKLAIVAAILRCAVQSVMLQPNNSTNERETKNLRSFHVRQPQSRSRRRREGCRLFQEQRIRSSSTRRRAKSRWTSISDVAPGHCKNMIGLAKIGYYDGVLFHRIIKGFMIQGGCPLGTGTGGPGYTINAEFNTTPHEAGVLSMARTSDPNSAGSQFFLCLGRHTHLDRQYTAFGKTADEASLAIVRKIGEVKTDSRDRPVSDVTIKSARVIAKAK